MGAKEGVRKDMLLANASGNGKLSSFFRPVAVNHRANGFKDHDAHIQT